MACSAPSTSPLTGTKPIKWRQSVRMKHLKIYLIFSIPSGDAYMVASGVPERMDSHVREIASVALMQRDVGGILNYMKIISLK
jgi:hypothetical protein